MNRRPSMWKRLLLAFVVSLISSSIATVRFLSGVGGAARAQEAPLLGKLAPSAAQADFDLMRKALEEAHTGLYRYTTKAQMDRAFDAQRSKLKRPMTKVEFLAVVAETLAQIRCGHTGAMPDEELQAQLKDARKFPLRLLPAGRGLIVVSNDTPDDRTIRPGMEIMAVNGREASGIFDRILPTVPTDRGVETRKWKRIQQGFRQIYWPRVDKAGDTTR